MKRRRQLVATLGITAVSAAFSVSAPAVQAAAAQSAYCGAYVVNTVDWLRVHTEPSVSSPAIGQIPGGSCWYDAGGRSGTWRHGYGYNGSTKLTGWADDAYIVDD